MKKARPLLIGLAMILAVFNGRAQTSSVEILSGKVASLGTLGEEYLDGFHTRFTVTINGACGGKNMNRSLVVRSGRMDGIFAHNAVAMKNAYSTLLSALLSGKSVMIAIPGGCSNGGMNLWDGNSAVLISN